MAGRLLVTNGIFFLETALVARTNFDSVETAQTNSGWDTLEVLLVAEIFREEFRRLGRCGGPDPACRAR